MLAQQADVALSWPAVATGVAAVLAIAGILAGWAAKAAKRARLRLEEMVQRVVTQVTPSNGTRLAEYTEQMAAQIDALTTRADTNRELATSALTLARHAHDRIDAHLVGHQTGDKT